MGTESAAAAGRVSRIVAWGERLPGGGASLGLGVALVLLAFQAVAHRMTEPEARLPFNWFRSLSLPLLTGYALFVTHEAARAARDALVALAPVLPGGDAEARSLADAARRPPSGAVRGAVIAGAAVPLLLGLVLADRVAATIAGDASALYFAFAAVLFWTAAALAAGHILAIGSLLGGVARHRVRVDLFRTEDLRPFGALGLRQALLVVGAMALVGLLGATPGAEEAWLWRGRLAGEVPLIVPLLLFSAVLAGVAFLQPMWAIRARVRREKESTLARLREQLGPHWEALPGTLAAPRPRAERALTILALRDQVARIPEWPVDGGMKRRFGLYLLIPLGSLVAQVALEQVLSKLVG